MAKVYLRVYARDIRKAVKERVEGPIIALTKNPQVLYSIANRGLRILNPYVPKKSGALRRSARVIQNSNGTYIRYGSPAVGRTQYYAQYQHDADDFLWHRTTPGTKSYWTKELEPGTPGWDELIAYATSIMRKELNGNK